jgi:SAM-dependent methyltransferase
VKSAVGAVLRVPAIKRILLEVPVVEKIYPGCERTHPFDRAHNVDTSGYLAADKIHTDPKMKDLVIPYSASQASIIREALLALGDVSEYTFIDFGCGKGRATLVATEFPFQQIVGVELSSTLAEVGRRNAEIFAKRFPDRPKIRIYTENVLNYELPKGKLVVYMYHSFARPVLAEILKRLAASVAKGHNTHLFVIYYNPMFGAELDASSALGRWFAKTIEYDRSELGFGPDKADTVVIWQSNQGAVSSPHAERGAKIIEIYPEWKVGLAAFTHSAPDMAIRE